MRRSLAAAIICALLTGACSISTSTDQVTQVADEAAPVSPAPAEPTAIPATPTAPADADGGEDAADDDDENAGDDAVDDDDGGNEDVAPEATVPDDSPVVVQGAGWVITQNEFDELYDLVAQAHELDWTDPVGVLISDDIGLEFARGFEPFQAQDWALFRGLGLAFTEDERLQANQLRLDRIRGFCCTGTPAGQTVVVELQDTKFATALIIVHELVHAIHSQNPELAPRGFETLETPFPAAAAFEGVPQYITFEFMKSGSAGDRAAVDPDLPIIRDDMLDLIQPGAARHLNFAYDTGPSFVEAVVAERGVQGLSEVMISPPITSEQVMFPEKYLAGEDPVPVDPLASRDGIRMIGRGAIGSAMFWFLLAEQHGADEALDMVEPWAGDAFIVYEIDDEICLEAKIVMDDDDAATSFSGLLDDALIAADQNAEVTTAVAASTIDLTVCH